MFKGMNAVEAKEYFGKTIDDELKFKEYFEKAVAELDLTVMAWIVDAWMENVMRREGLLSLTKVKGDSVLKRVYEDEVEREDA